MFALPWLETDESETECSIFEQLRRCAGLILQHHGTTGKLGVSPYRHRYSNVRHSPWRSSYCHPPRAPGRKSCFILGTERRYVPIVRMSGLHVFPRHYPLDNAHAGDSNCHTITAAPRQNISAGAHVFSSGLVPAVVEEQLSVANGDALARIVIHLDGRLVIVQPVAHFVT
jgi:hypothetical protein